MKTPQVCIIIPNWNGKSLLRNCLESIKTNTAYPRYETIVVDNGSKDGSVEIIKKEFPSVRLICNKENLGFPKACNQGIKHALKKYNSDYVFLLNNDTRITQQDWLGKLVGTTRCGDKIGIVGCKLLPPNGRPHLIWGQIKPSGWNRADISNSEKMIEVDAVSGAGFLIGKDVIEKIGLLDEGFSPYLYEETDYFIRAKKAGYKIVYNPKVVLIHWASVSFEKVEKNSVFFVERKNAIRFALLNYPLSWLVWEFVYGFLATFLEKKNAKAGLTPTNIKLRRDPLKVNLFLNACWINLKNLREILEKRRNRTAKIWY
jgi:hypothetical protein